MTRSNRLHLNQIAYRLGLNFEFLLLKGSAAGVTGCDIDHNNIRGFDNGSSEAEAAEPDQN